MPYLGEHDPTSFSLGVASLYGLLEESIERWWVFMAVRDRASL